MLLNFIAFPLKFNLFFNCKVYAWHVRLPIKIDTKINI